MVRRKSKKVNIVLLTVFIITFVSLFSYFLVSGIVDLIGDKFNASTKIIIGLVGLIIATGIGWVKSR